MDRTTEEAELRLPLWIFTSLHDAFPQEGSELMQDHYASRTEETQRLTYDL